MTDCGSNQGSQCRLDSQSLIEGFIDTQVTGRGLDGRTEKAYRLDLEHFYVWLEQERCSNAEAGERTWEEEMERYFHHLRYRKGLRPSTISRKQRVLSYYLTYLVKQGALTGFRPLGRVRIKADVTSDNAASDMSEEKGTVLTGSVLSKKEVDLFFKAINREYEDLDSSFRKRVCLRDLVMMQLLFYHGIEISELLRMEVSDYDPKTGMLTVRRKRDRNYSVYLFSQVLREKMAMWLEERGYFERDEAYGDRMFLSKLGRPLSMKMVIMIFDKYRVMAGIERECTPKDLKCSMKRYARELMMEKCS